MWRAALRRERSGHRAGARRSAISPALLHARARSRRAVRPRRPVARARAGRRDRRADARREPARLRGHRPRQARRPRAQLFVRRRPDLPLRSRRRCRGGRARSRTRRRCGSASALVELLQKRTEDGYAFRVDLRLRPVARGDADRAAGRRRDQLLRIAPPCPGSGPPSSAPAQAAGDPRSAAISSRRSIRSSGAARSISARSARSSRDHPPDPRPLCAGPGLRPRLRSQARPRRHPRDRVLRPDPPADPWRPRAGAARAGARSRRSPRSASAGRIGAGGAPRRCATPIACSARSSTGCRWSTTGRPTACRATPTALDNVARLHGLASGADLLDLLAPHVARVAAIYDTLGDGRRAPAARRSAGARSERSAAAGFRRSGAARGCGSRAGARAGSARCATAAGARGVRGDAAGPDRGVRRGARSDARAEPLRGSDRRRLPSGVNFYRLLEARPALDPASRRDPQPCAGAGRAARPAARAARRPDRRQRLRARAGPVDELVARLRPPDRAGEDYQLLLDRVRRRVNERRFALGVQLVAGGERSDRGRPRAMRRVAEAAIHVLAAATVAEFEAGARPGAGLGAASSSASAGSAAAR